MQKLSLLATFLIISILISLVTVISTAETVSVGINAPGGVCPNDNFTVEITVTQVYDLDTASFRLDFDQNLAQYQNINTEGTLTEGAVPTVNDTIPGKITVVINIPGTKGVSGTGALVKINFIAIGETDKSTDITLSDVLLGDILANPIPFVIEPSSATIMIGASGTVTLDPDKPKGPPTWYYVLTWNCGSITQWSYEGASIIGADVTGAAAAAGWIVESKEQTRVVFSKTGAPMTEGEVSGFEISGLTGGVGKFTVGINSGDAEGALPVKLSHFIASRTSEAVIIKWRTESETNNLGFNLYRSENRQGKYVRVNSHLIAGAGSTDKPHTYQFVDEGITAGKTYYYYIEYISLNGTKEKSPIIEAIKGTILDWKLLTSWGKIKSFSH